MTTPGPRSSSTCVPGMDSSLPPPAILAIVRVGDNSITTNREVEYLVGGGAGTTSTGHVVWDHNATPVGPKTPLDSLPTSVRLTAPPQPTGGGTHKPVTFRVGNGIPISPSTATYTAIRKIVVIARVDLAKRQDYQMTLTLTSIDFLRADGSTIETLTKRCVAHAPPRIIVRDQDQDQVQGQVQEPGVQNGGGGAADDGAGPSGGVGPRSDSDSFTIQPPPSTAGFILNLTAHLVYHPPTTGTGSFPDGDDLLGRILVIG